MASGGTTELHLSSAGGRPVTVEVARVSATRDVVWTGRFEADEHPTCADAHSHGGRRPGEYLRKPPGAGGRVTTVHPPNPDMNTHVGYLQRHRLSGYAGSAGWPDREQPFLAWAERHGHGIDLCTNADLEDHPELIDRYRLLPARPVRMNRPRSSSSLPGGSALATLQRWTGSWPGTPCSGRTRHPVAARS